jgi:hypothetical protein
MVFVGGSKEIGVYNLKLATTTSFRIISDSVLTSPTIRSCVISGHDSVAR